MPGIKTRSSKSAALAGQPEPGHNGHEPGVTLSVEHVSFAYSSINVLENINLKIANGEFVAVLGPSGCGKTSFLRLLAGLEKPTTGEIHHDGNLITGPDIKRGVVFQDYSLFPWLNLQDNLSIAINKSRKGLARAERNRIAEEYLELVGLHGEASKHPYEVSGGMRQRAAIARSLALGSPVFLMDEPFGALDPVNRVRLQDLLIQLCHVNAARRTVVFVTHDVEEALFMGDRVIVMGTNPGRIIADIKVPYTGKHNRHVFFQSKEFREIEEQIAALYHEDIERQLEAGSVVSGEGALI
ncbi:MAG TPA: ABC transporter ATP-binding protein [Chlorobaculum sp.]|nr:ABC transporter ATP-binding protein [Chlorobaculum sp.]